MPNSRANIPPFDNQRLIQPAAPPSLQLTKLRSDPLVIPTAMLCASNSDIARPNQVTPPPPPPPRPTTASLAAIRSSADAAMANFPFDPLPFLPAGHQPIQVEGRLARVRVVYRHIHRRNKNLAMAMIIPMPAGMVHFPNVREILSEFLTLHKHLGFRKISKCPMGQAFVQLHSIFDRDELVNQSPHCYDDVYIIFEKHDEGMNWRRFHLNHECWTFIAGFHADLRNLTEIGNAVKSFSTFLAWDQELSSDAGVLVKIGVEELKDIPSSILLSGSESVRGDSCACPVTILQQRLIVDGPQDEEAVPEDGNPHPIIEQQHFHPN